VPRAGPGVVPASSLPLGSRALGEGEGGEASVRLGRRGRIDGAAARHGAGAPLAGGWGRGGPYLSVERREPCGRGGWTVLACRLTEQSRRSWRGHTKDATSKPGQRRKFQLFRAIEGSVICSRALQGISPIRIAMGWVIIYKIRIFETPFSYWQEFLQPNNCTAPNNMA